MCNFGDFLPKINFLIFLHEGPFLEEGGPEKQPIYLYWPYSGFEKMVTPYWLVHMYKALNFYHCFLVEVKSTVANALQNLYRRQFCMCNTVSS